MRCISFCDRICRTKKGARMVRMTMVKAMIASAKSKNGISYRKTRRLKSGRKKTSQGGLKLSIPRNPWAMIGVNSALLV